MRAHLSFEKEGEGYLHDWMNGRVQGCLLKEKSSLSVKSLAFDQNPLP
jgi:hypothetical protein